MATVEIRELIKPETGEKFYPYAHLNGVKGAELLPRIGSSVQTTLLTPIFQIKDALNAQFYPQTHAEAVIGLAQMIESNQFFVKESDGNGGFRIKLKDEFTGFYANGWAAAGGVGTGGGGGGYGVEEITSNEDGTVDFHFTGGDVTTVDLNHEHPQYASKMAETSQPSGGFLPDVVYELGTLTGSVTFALASAVSGQVNHYFWTFTAGSTAPTITWPSGITWADSAPTITASKKYQISILDGVAAYMEA